MTSTHMHAYTQEDGQDAQCECVECAGAAPAQQEEQAGKKEKKGRGRSCAVSQGQKGAV